MLSAEPKIYLESDIFRKLLIHISDCLGLSRDSPNVANCPMMGIRALVA